MKRRKIYIGGPMRGFEGYNFPAFDAAAEKLFNEGWYPVNPADVDRDCGYYPEEFPAGHNWNEVPEGMDLRDVVRRDLDELVGCEAIFLLKGWEKSKGAKAELAVAIWLGLEILFEGQETEFEQEDVLLEALRLTSGDRQASYGPPNQDFERTANLWNTLFAGKLKEKFLDRDVATAMVCLKLSRLCHSLKRDSVVDLAGYARCFDICVQSAGGYTA